MRPISRRQFKRGGAVAEGEEPKKRADRHSRRKRRTGRDLPKYKDGGSVPLTADSLVNKDMKEANELRKGEKHIGGLKKGGRAKRAAGGVGSFVQTPMQMMMEQNHPARRAKDEREKRAVRKSGGRTGKAGGGVMEALSPAYALFKNRDKDAVKALSPIANLKKGGHVDAKMDASMIKNAVHKHEGRLHAGKMKTKLASGGYAKGGALDGTMQGTRPMGGRIARARGGLLKGHPYHDKTDAELRYIVKDAGKAARSMKGMDEKAEGKYLDQVNDASSILHARTKDGRLARKDGGTVTNIYFDSKKGGGEGPPGGLMPPMMPPPMPPMPPPGMPPGGPPMPPPHMGPPPGGPPMGPPPGGPPGMPPGMPPMMRRAGGRVGNRTYRKPQDMDAGAGSGLGRLEKIQIQKGK
jgi:hypothetical protein